MFKYLIGINAGIFKYVFVGAAATLTIWDNVCYFPSVEGVSMQPLLNHSKDDGKDRVFVLRLLYNPLINEKPLIEDMVSRGEVVSILSPKNPNESFVKRIVGMPGDLVKTIRHKRDYVLVPQGHCWIEGDNFEKSYDSNAFGCVPLGLILGKVKYVCYPFKRIDPQLPKHRKLCVLNGEEHKYLIDFCSEKENDEEDDEEDSMENEYDSDDPDNNNNEQETGKER